MGTAFEVVRRPVKGVLALVVALAAVVSVLSIGARPAAAQAAQEEASGSVGVAAIAHARARSRGSVTHEDFALNQTGALQAQLFVHTRSYCGDSFCTIQRLPDRYRAYRMTGCDTFDLFNFAGLFDAHNHGSLMVHFLDSVDKEIGWYAGGRHDAVRWDPVYAVRTCNR